MISPGQSFWFFLIEIIILASLWSFIVEFNDGFSKEEDIEKIARDKIFPPTGSQAQSP